jgi:hypothetical protein
MKAILTKIDSKDWVKEHKNYTREFDEITELLKAKRIWRVR